MSVLTTELMNAVEWDRDFGSAFRVFQVCADNDIQLLLHIQQGDGTLVVLTSGPNASYGRLAAMKSAETPMIAIEAAVRDFVERLDEAEAGV